MSEICDSCKLVFEIVDRRKIFKKSTFFPQFIFFTVLFFPTLDFVGNEFNVEKQLEKEEVLLLIQWIRNSADFKSGNLSNFFTSFPKMGLFQIFMPLRL